MTWLVFALISPAAWAFVNYTDKFFLGSLLKGKSPKILMSLDFFVTVVVAFFIYFFLSESLFLNAEYALYAFLGGILGMSGAYCYYLAIQYADPTAVVPLFQFIPLFIAPIAFVVLGEVLTFEQLIAAGIIILGGYIVSLRHIDDVTHLDRRTLLLMAAAALLMAVSSVLFKLSNEVYAYWDAIIFARVGNVLLPLYFLTSKHVQVEVLKLAKVIAKPKLSFIFLLRVAFTYCAIFSFLYAVTLAPATLVQAVSGLQPVFILIIGTAFALFAPHYFGERFDGKNLRFKIVGTIAVFIGLLLLLFW